jgi:portal protein
MGFVKTFLTPWRDPDVLHRDVEPLEGTNISLFTTIIPNWWTENGLTSGSWTPGNASLAQQVWVADRCIQLNSQQIAAMPLVFNGDRNSTDAPAWVSNPDPNMFPNGIGDALHFIVSQLYGWGFSCQYVTDFYADGFPRSWTVLSSEFLNIKFEDGARQYKYGEQILDPRRVIQIDRNPSTAAHGTSALRAYAQQAWGLLAAGNQQMNVNQGGTPAFYLKSERKLTKDQATDLQTQWMTATTSRNGAPPVVPPEITPTEMSFNPSDLALLESQEWNAKAIATAFGVPATLLNMAIDGGLTYNNPALLGEQWWRFELRCFANKIANAFTAQALPRGNWVSFDAADTFLPLDTMTDDDDPQLSQVAKASPAQQQRPLTAIGGGA